MIDWTKPIQTRIGETAEVLWLYGSQVTSMYRRVCVVGKGTRDERVIQVLEDGHFYTNQETESDIVNVPEEKLIGVVNVYRGCVESHDCREHADDGAQGCNRTHVVTITRCGDEVKATLEKVQ